MSEAGVSGKTLKLGIKIEKPSIIQIHPIYPILLFLSLALIGLTGWLLVWEFLGEPPPPWLRALLDNFVLMF